MTGFKGLRARGRSVLLFGRLFAGGNRRRKARFRAAVVGLLVLVFTTPTHAAVYTPGGTGGVWNGYLITDTTPMGRSATGKTLTYAGAWLDVVNDTNISGSAKVEIDWMRLMGRKSNGSVVILREETYTSSADGGLFGRYPWYGSNGYSSLPYTISAGTCVLYPHQRSDRIYHLWAARRTQIPSGYTKIWVETRVRVSGSGAIKAGFDWMQESSAGPRWSGGKLDNWGEGARGYWRGNTKGAWVVITAG
jgi:hypothetical protein